MDTSFAPFLLMSALVGLGLVFSALTFVWLALYSVAIAKVGALVQGMRARRAIDGMAGVALIGLAVKVALEDR